MAILAAAWIAAIAAVAWWVLRTPELLLRVELMRWQFWNLEAQFLVFVALALGAVPALVRALHLRRADFRIPLIAAAAALLLTTFAAPRTSRIYYDEQIYQSVGQNLADLKRAQMCNDGNVEYGALQCWRGEYNKEPSGYPYLLSLVYRVVGAHDGIANALNSVAAALLVLTVALITIALTDSVRAGGWAAAICALIPEQLRWSHTAAAEPTATLACAVALLSALAFVRTRRTVALLLDGECDGGGRAVQAGVHPRRRRGRRRHAAARARRVQGGTVLVGGTRRLRRAVDARRAHHGRPARRLGGDGPALLAGLCADESQHEPVVLPHRRPIPHGVHPARARGVRRMAPGARWPFPPSTSSPSGASSSSSTPAATTTARTIDSR